MTATTRSRVPAKKAPTPRKKPSAAAREAEADDGFVHVQHCGIELRIPVGGKVPLAAMDAFRNGDNFEGTKRLLGKVQWQLICDAELTAADLDELGDKLVEAQGN